MAKKVQQEDILRMVELYHQIGTYAGVAREVGFSASTVRKYVFEFLLDRNDVPQDTSPKKAFSTELIQDVSQLVGYFTCVNWGDLCVLTKDENNEVEELWKELKR